MNDSINKKLHLFFSQFQHKKYRPKEIIMYPDNTPTGAFFLLKGNVREYGISLDGMEVTIHIFAQYSFFPMMCVISDIKNRYYYEALAQTELYFAPKNEVLSFLKQNPDVLFSLTQRLLKGLDKLTMRIEELTSTTASYRLVSTLIFLTRHFGIERQNALVLDHIFTQKDIASLTGLTRETISREWKKLEKKKLIKHQGKSIVIEDINKLKYELL